MPPGRGLQCTYKGRTCALPQRSIYGEVKMMTCTYGEELMKMDESAESCSAAQSLAESRMKCL